MQKSLILLGGALIVAGLLWPWVSKITLGRLPGDLLINRPHLKIYIPVTGMIALSLIVSFIIWIFRK